MRPLILSGPPRSGTTLCSALLDGHSSINWFIDEGFFFEHLDKLGAENFDRFVRAAQLDVESLIAGLRDRFIMPPTGSTTDFPSLKIKWSDDAFRKALADKRAATVHELWIMLRDAYIAGFGYEPRQYVSMKAADYGSSVFGALDHFDDARGIIIVREPVAMLNSLKAYRKKSNRRLLTWPTLVEAIDAMNALARRVDIYDAAQLTVVRYEDFAGFPEKEMRRLCDWLGVPFESVLTTPSMMGQPWSNNSSFTDRPSGVDALPERKMVLSDAERDYVEWASGPFRERFAYV